jgi:transcriptional regulator with XRE-family HTH domain
VTGPVTAAISAELRAARTAAGATREDVVAAARAAGAPATLTTPTLRNIESGRRSASVDEVVWLAAALEVSPRRLLGEHADLFGQAPKAAARGPVEESTRAAVDELDELAGPAVALAESAFALARSLDRGGSSSPAAVARELRATLGEIWTGQDDGDDDGDGFDPE